GLAHHRSRTLTTLAAAPTIVAVSERVAPAFGTSSARRCLCLLRASRTRVASGSNRLFWVASVHDARRTEFALVRGERTGSPFVASLPKWVYSRPLDVACPRFELFPACRREPWVARKTYFSARSRFPPDWSPRRTRRSASRSVTSARRKGGAAPRWVPS